MRRWSAGALLGMALWMPWPANAARSGAEPADPEADPIEALAVGGEASPEQAGPAQVPGAQLEAALLDHRTGRHALAARGLFAALASLPPADDRHAWAQLWLATSLEKLGYTHAAAVTYARIARERADPQVLTKAVLALRELARRPHDEKLIDEQVFGALEVKFLPAEVDAYSRYRQGLRDLHAGNDRWARAQFARIPKGSPEYYLAWYATLAHALARAGTVKSELIAAFEKLAQDAKAPEFVQRDARMAAARLRYDRKDYAGALTNYLQVKPPRLDPGRAALYLEEAWTRYHLGELQRALSLLVALDAPAFRDEFAPDVFLLRALIYRDLCHYLPAKRAAAELFSRYADPLRAISERTDLLKSPKLRRAAAARGPGRRALRFLDGLQRESDRLGQHAATFGSALHAHLAEVYGLAMAEVTRTLEPSMRRGVEQEADRLLEAAEQVRLVEYEVGLRLYERMKADALARPAPEEDALSPDSVAYAFSGEYWNDELRSFQVEVKSRCEPPLEASR